MDNTLNIKSLVIGAITTILLIIAIGAVIASIDAQNSRIVNVAAPTTVSDLARKGYADALNGTYNGHTCSGASGCTSTCDAGTTVIQAMGWSTTATSGSGCSGDTSATGYVVMANCLGATSCAIANCGTGNEGNGILCGK